jgi:uncharacterized protein (TIGR02271 family)
LAETEAPLGTTVQPRTDLVDQAGETVVPLLAEEVSVSKQTIETGRVQVSRVTHHREQLIDEVLARERVEVERIPVGRQIDVMPAVREEGETTVVPIVEEVLVVERRLFLKEEVRIRRVRTTEKHLETVSLRHQEAVVKRLPIETPAAGESAETGASVQSNKGEGVRS